LSAEFEGALTVFGSIGRGGEIRQHDEEVPVKRPGRA
jgi:hypothetical protein